MTAVEKQTLRFILAVLDSDGGITSKAYLAFHSLTNCSSGQFLRNIIKIANCVEGTDEMFYLQEGVAFDLAQEFGL